MGPVVVTETFEVLTEVTSSRRFSTGAGSNVGTGPSPPTEAFV